MTNNTPKWEEEFEYLCKGIDKDNTEDDEGWWETSKGVVFGKAFKNCMRSLLKKVHDEAYERGRKDEWDKIHRYN